MSHYFSCPDGEYCSFRLSPATFWKVIGHKTCYWCYRCKSFVGPNRTAIDRINKIVYLGRRLPRRHGN